MSIYVFRFPVPDLRTNSDDNDSFWYKRDVYNDLLFIELTEMSTQSRESSHQVARSFELQCKSVRVVFQVIISVFLFLYCDDFYQFGVEINLVPLSLLWFLIFIPKYSIV